MGSVATEKVPDEFIWCDVEFIGDLDVCVN